MRKDFARNVQNMIMSALFQEKLKEKKNYFYFARKKVLVLKISQSYDIERDRCGTQI